jgi:CheY-like chemotaxis protein
MMPKMDGIEATKIIRDMGYTNTIVALTANALIGRAQMFLENGFDGFISKPIDSRELNFVLNDFIRNKQPPEVIEAARIEQYEKEYKKRNVMQGNISKTDTYEKEMFFIRDAENAINVLSSGNFNTPDDEEIYSYITTVHGMKSALANIGEKELSVIANMLEQAGIERNLAVISSETPTFINALQSLIVELRPDSEEDVTISEENQAHLLEKLHEIKTACAESDKKTVKAALNELRQKKWPKHIKTVFEKIAVHILHTEFDEAAAVAKNAAEDLLPGEE